MVEPTFTFEAPSTPATVHAWAGARFAGTPTAALLALDATLTAIVRRARDPLVGQMRLTWWHEALSTLSESTPPAEPVLRALAAKVIARGVTAERIAALVEGWEVLLEETPDAEALVARHAAERGQLFALAGACLDHGQFEALAAAGQTWALADLAAHVADPALLNAARERGIAAAAAVRGVRWPAPLRGLGGMGRDAGMALAGQGAAGSPRRALAVAKLALLGR